MNINFVVFLRKLCMLEMMLLCGCSIYDFDDESDYAPSVRDVVGCWLSTENLGENRYVTHKEINMIWSEDITVNPSRTCVEFCVHKDASFTYVARYAAGSEYFPDFSADLYGTVEPDSVNAFGDGGTQWNFHSSKRNVVVPSDSETANKNFDLESNSGIRLVEGVLSGLHFGRLEYEDKYGHMGFYSEQNRKFSRTNDKKACDNFWLK